ncbi:HD-GYP domain-containing protein [Sporomusa acidovorans]|uniref:Cyclic di-GMP phosphodiesterase n=1 Tax=Sporomusa acidovorans (strain ATCC 49682 / DSM 3132 / Mol) TaxID=1123286 RepID=A0ABZ3JB39_SPOA4|nr:HD-GYP domain-containing protein [Sporomusa acidovorans]OZC21675.1 cyclic di-GMP phosphodiesterase response regulator RpfG [Sporomusa acidovorans DSM 3132]SDD60366.1 HDIG domain-containing protein [Sporomusa acidovorans]
MSIIQTFCQALGERDSYTGEHCKNVARLMAGFAEYAEFSAEDITLAYIVGIVHDVGKVSMPNHILNKPGRLTEAEFAIIKQHPDIGASLLAEVDGLEKVAEIVRFHHERFDGRGYGKGLAGHSIPFFSRMLSVCDTFDAMTSARCYRRTPLTVSQALAEIASCAGTQLDPSICECFIDFIRSFQERALP